MRSGQAAALGSAVHGSAACDSSQLRQLAARRSLTRAARDCARLATARGTVAYSSASSSSARSSSARSSSARSSLACSSGLGPPVGRSGLGHLARSLSPRPRPTPRLGSRPAEDARERACERETGCACAARSAGHQGWTHGGRVAQDVCVRLAERRGSASFAAGGAPRSPMVAGRSRSSHPKLCKARARSLVELCLMGASERSCATSRDNVRAAADLERAPIDSSPNRAARKCTF